MPSRVPQGEVAAVPQGEVTDGSGDDFSAGSSDSDASVANTLGGEVLLRPKVAG